MDKRRGKIVKELDLEGKSHEIYGFYSWNPCFTSTYAWFVFEPTVRVTIPRNSSQIEFHPGMLRFSNTKLFTSYGTMQISPQFTQASSDHHFLGILIRNSEFLMLVYKLSGFTCVSLSSFSLRRFLCFPMPCIILSSAGADLSISCGVNSWPKCV